MSEAPDIAPYPGDGADAASLLKLAQAYGRAALSLREVATRGVMVSWSPMRLCAIHGLELYLSAFLMKKGATAKDIRTYRHDLGIRVSRARELGLSLKKRTSEHLARLTDDREYLVSRYEPDPPKLSEVNRLVATLEEVDSKVAAVVNGSAP